MNRRIILFLAMLLGVTSLAGVTAPSATAETVTAPVTGQGHVQNIGWMAPTSGTIGTTGKALRLEAVRIPGPLRVEAHVQNIGWMPYVDMQAPGAYAGTTGKALRLEAVRIWFAPYWEPETTGTSIEYRCHIENIGWVAWVRNGEQCGTTGRSLRMEAIELRTVKDSAPTPTPTPSVTPSVTPSITPTVSGTPTPTPSATSTPSTFAVTADTGMESTGAAVLSSIGNSGVGWVAHLGDLSYMDTAGIEQQWCAWAKARISQPLELLPGTHEGVAVHDGVYANYVSCLPDRLGVTGSYAGGSYYVDRDGVRYIGISPNVDLPTGTKTYSQGTVEREVLKGWIDTAKAQGMWVIVGMHHGCLTLGTHGCASDPSLTDMLIGKHVDVVIAGHDHNYARSHQITGTVSGPVVVDRDSRFTAGAGTVFMTVGSGGHNPRELAGPVSGIWAAGAPGTITGWAKVSPSPSSLMVQWIRTDGAPADGFIVSR